MRLDASEILSHIREQHRHRTRLGRPVDRHVLFDYEPLKLGEPLGFERFGRKDSCHARRIDQLPKLIGAKAAQRRRPKL